MSQTRPAKKFKNDDNHKKCAKKNWAVKKQVAQKHNVLPRRQQTDAGQFVKVEPPM
jgi:hypothetical protein